MDAFVGLDREIALVRFLELLGGHPDDPGLDVDERRNLRSSRCSTGQAARWLRCKDPNCGGVGHRSSDRSGLAGDTDATERKPPMTDATPTPRPAGIHLAASDAGVD